MNNKWIILMILIMALVATFACGLASPSGLGSEILVHIRIKNETGQYIDKYWLGSDSQHGFGDIEVGELTDYKSTGTHPSGYRVSSIVSNGESYASILLPFIYEELESGELNIVYQLDLDNSGEPTLLEELEPGKYTFTLRLDSMGEPVLSVFRDE